MDNHEERCEPAVAARLLWSERYPSANLLFCSGSVVRGEGYASSDLDVVVVFDTVTNAWRDSFHFKGWPVEVFAHDPETLVHFVEADCSRGRPALAQMITEALVVPEAHAWTERIQGWARSILAEPPAPSAGVAFQDRLAERYRWQSIASTRTAQRQCVGVPRKARGFA